MNPRRSTVLVSRTFVVRSGVSFPLATGAEARWTGTPGRRAVVCVNGGTAAEVPGTWSASVEWLVQRLSRRFPELGFLEVRYRIKSWRRLDLCVEDAAAAIEAARASGAEELALLGFSMGGAVAVRNAAAAGVELVAGVNPWLPPAARARHRCGAGAWRSSTARWMRRCR